MNVDVLRNNPDWRWYIFFVAVILLVTLMGWLIFKYNPVSKPSLKIEHWIEQKTYGLLHSRKRQNFDHDVEKTSPPEDFIFGATG